MIYYHWTENTTAVRVSCIWFPDSVPVRDSADARGLHGGGRGSQTEPRKPRAARQEEHSTLKLQLYFCFMLLSCVHKCCNSQILHGGVIYQCSAGLFFKHIKRRCGLWSGRLTANQKDVSLGQLIDWDIFLFRTRNKSTARLNTVIFALFGPTSKTITLNLEI